MGKKSVGKEKYESQKDSVKDYNGTPNDALADVGDHKDSNKKRKLQLDLTERFHGDRKKEKRAKYDGEASGLGDKERKKNRMASKSELELDSARKEKEKRSKDDLEGREVGNEKEKRKGRKNKKDKYNAEAVQIEEVSNDTHAVGLKKAKKDSRTLGDTDVGEVGREEKKRKKKDKYDAKAVAAEEVSNNTHAVVLKKTSKDSRTLDDTEVSEMGCEEKARKDDRTSDDTEVDEVGCEEKKKKKDRKNKKDENDVVEPSGVQAVPSDTHVKIAKKGSKKGKRTKSDAEGPNDEQNSRMKTIDLQASDTEEKIREKKKGSDDLGVGLQETEAVKPVNASCGAEDDNCMEAGSHKNPGNKGKKKKAKSVKKVSDGKVEKLLKPNLSKNYLEKETPKRVSFSDQVEVFPLSDGPSNEDNACEDGPSDAENADKDGLVRGKRFTPEEDEMIKKAVFDYIEQHNLGEEGVDKILHCRFHKELRNCWKDIATALPWRPYESVYYRGHILFERAETSKWTADEYDLVRKYHEKHGSDWRTLADALGKHRFHVKDTWRRIKLPNMKKGHWSQDEYQGLFDLVNMDLRMKAFQEKKSKHGMLRDNICWSAVSDKLSTRTNAICCRKWYSQLTSSMVADGNWADTDDYRLLDALQVLDACSMEDVDWDNLLEHRPGDVCRKRWKQMVNHLGHLGTKSFAEQVEVLSQRYCLDVLEPREAYDSKPAADS